jgi:hypothetical protein
MTVNVSLRCGQYHGLSCPIFFIRAREIDLAVIRCLRPMVLWRNHCLAAGERCSRELWYGYEKMIGEGGVMAFLLSAMSSPRFLRVMVRSGKDLSLRSR